MSVELKSLEPMPKQTRPIRDVIVILGGWGGASLKPVPLPEDDKNYHSDTAFLYRETKKLSDAPFHEKKVLGIEGTAGYNPSSPLTAVGVAMSFIIKHFHPEGQLIVHGHSMGGVNALQLCRSISERIPYYNLSSRQFALSGVHGKDIIGRVIVDILFTVDAAFSDASSMVDRTVDRCVRNNINYFQSNAKSDQERSVGAPNTAANAASTDIQNLDWTEFADHHSIDFLSNPAVLMKIRERIEGRQAPPAVAPRGAAVA